MRLGLLLLVLLITPTITFANIEITEIMYDLEGTDSKREWIEIYNSGESTIDITDWRFNDGSNHTFVGDRLEIFGREYAVIASDKESFTGSGLIIDTVMSLNNTTDSISLINEEGMVVYSTTYTSELGAGGNGNSLQKINGVWIESFPTPNEENIKEIVSEIEPTEEKTVLSENISSTHRESMIQANAGTDKEELVSALVFFDGESYGLKGNTITNARYVWNFGDGIVYEGKNVTHTYTYPGTYIATLNISSGEYSASDSIVVEVNKADVEITYADRGRIEITNNSDKKLNLSFWNIKYKDTYFSFPKGTYILSKHVGIFPALATNMFVDALEDVSLLYPNGLEASMYLSNIEQVPQTKPKVENVPEKIIEYIYISKEKEEDIIKKEEILISTTSLIASIQESNLLLENEPNNSLYKWLVALVSLISVAILIALSSSKFSKKEKTLEELKADDFKILE